MRDLQSRIKVGIPHKINKIMRRVELWCIICFRDYIQKIGFIEAKILRFRSNHHFRVYYIWFKINELVAGDALNKENLVFIDTNYYFFFKKIWLKFFSFILKDLKFLVLVHIKNVHLFFLLIRKDLVYRIWVIS